MNSASSNTGFGLPPGVTATQLANDERLVWAAYAAHMISYLMLWTALIGLIINYVRRKDCVDPKHATHHSRMLRTFWWTFGLSLLAFGIMIAGGLGVAFNLLGPDFSQWERSVEAIEKGTARLNIAWGWVVLAALGALLAVATWIGGLISHAIGMVRLADDKPT
ncbi:hypothetical protein IP84_04155 [beta proteobacterium AAP99]|nr:hypothetical protein IP84_04155 [beta proteobacterium AAP99]